MLAISVLGPVEVRSDGRSLVVPAGKTTEVLIRLALDSTVTVSADRLTEDLWGAGMTDLRIPIQEATALPMARRDDQHPSTPCRSPQGGRHDHPRRHDNQHTHLGHR